MKRIPKVIAVVGLALLPVAGLGAAATASTPHSTVAGVDDFTFTSFDADYYLDTDASGRSTLKTVETFVAAFPDTNQNHGMKRAIPTDYQGTPTDIEVESVTDGDGNPRPFTTDTDDGFLVVTSADKQFVHGEQTYVFTYTQHNVTKFFADSNDDELYWDTVGTGWDQPFGTVTAHFHVPANLVGDLTGDVACYQGAQRSKDTCEATSSPEGSGTVFDVAVNDVGPHQNVTVAIGFTPHTFAARDDSYFASPFAVLQLLGLFGVLAALAWAIVLRRTVFADGKGRPTIIAEYTPPDDVDLVTAAVIMKRIKRAAAAEFVDLAVKRKVRIVETEKKGFFSSSVQYLLELVDASGLTGGPLDFAGALFGNTLVPGTSYLMSGKDVELSQRVRMILQSTTSQVARGRLRKKSRLGLSTLVALLGIFSGAGAFIFGIALVGDARGGVIPLLFIIVAVVAAFIVLRLVYRATLSDAGAELRDHLKGLELYIRLAEADRLRMLQSPTGAERGAISTSDPRQVLNVYEKLLPYAVLFNLEKQWAVELGKYYTDQSPDWYSGSGAFNAAIFASSISTLSSTVASSYSGTSSSSSSGGSGGGGFSGGGGGGGGGGGV